MISDPKANVWELARERAPTPCYVIDESLVAENLRLLDEVQRDAGCKVLLALKGFACPDLFPLISKSLAGTTASSLDEARLAREEFGGEVHIYAPAYKPDEFPEILECVDHIVFNTFAQWRTFKPQVEACLK